MKMLKKILLYFMFVVGLLFLFLALASVFNLHEPGAIWMVFVFLIPGLPLTIYSYKKLFPKKLHSDTINSLGMNMPSAEISELKKVILYLLFILGLFFLLLGLVSIFNRHEPGMIGMVVLSLLLGLPLTSYSFKILFSKKPNSEPSTETKAEESYSHSVQKQIFLKGIRAHKNKFLYLSAGVLFFLWLLWPVDQNLPAIFYGKYYSDYNDETNSFKSISLDSDHTFSGLGVEGKWKLQSRSGTSPKDWRFSIKFIPSNISSKHAKLLSDDNWNLDVNSYGRNDPIPNLKIKGHERFKHIDQNLPSGFYGHYSERRGIRGIRINRDGTYKYEGYTGKWKISIRSGESKSNWSFGLMLGPLTNDNQNHKYEGYSPGYIKLNYSYLEYYVLSYDRYIDGVSGALEVLMRIW
jgi:hypothetical protein